MSVFLQYLQDIQHISTVMPHWHRYGVLVIIIATFVLFVCEIFPLEIVALASVALFAFIFGFFPLPNGNFFNGVFLGFSNSSLITIICLSIVGQGLYHTGVIERISAIFVKASKLNLCYGIASIFCGAYLISGYFNNIPAVMLFIPILVIVCEKSKMASSKVLMPLAFISTLGGMTTLIGSGTNILVNTSLQSMGIRSFTFYEFFVPAIIMGAVGILYLVIFAHKLLPESPKENNSDNHRSFLVQLEINSHSSLIGISTDHKIFTCIQKIALFSPISQRTYHIQPDNHRIIQAGDILQLTLTRDILLKIISQKQILSNLMIHELSENTQTIEVVNVLVSSLSSYKDKSFREITHHLPMGTQCLGIKLQTDTSHKIPEDAPFCSINNLKISDGDRLMIIGYSEAISELNESHDLIPLEGSRHILPALKYSGLALSIFLFMIASIISQAVNIEIASFLGASLMIITNSLPLRFAKKIIDVKIIMLIVSALAMANGLAITHTDKWLADILIEILPSNNPLYNISLLFLIIAFFTNILTNHACAVLFTPIAVSFAQDLDVDAMILAVTVVFASNVSFATPFAHPTNLLVMSAGKYSFKDYFKLGCPLIILMWITFTITLKLYYKI